VAPAALLEEEFSSCFFLSISAPSCRQNLDESSVPNNSSSSFSISGNVFSLLMSINT
jgi:hypothetical protein